eukprot:scaffold16948_cov52-Phaeocystis_antarctica.AAC.2
MPCSRARLGPHSAVLRVALVCCAAGGTIVDTPRSGGTLDRVYTTECLGVDMYALLPGTGAPGPALVGAVAFA